MSDPAFGEPDPIFGAPNPVFGAPAFAEPVAPPAPVTPTVVEFEKPESRGEQRAAEGKPARKPLHERIPKLPEMERMDPAKLQQPEQRQVACVNMKLAGASFAEIAKELDYANADSARTAYYSALANMHPPEDIETMRQMEGMRAEALFRKSLAMASADYLVATELVKNEDTGEWEEVEVRVPNTEKLRWHDQAAKDLALHAAITGAKAPARMEINASTEEINRIVHLIATHEGGEDLEADIFEIAQIEAIDAEIVEED